MLQRDTTRWLSTIMGSALLCVLTACGGGGSSDASGTSSSTGTNSSPGNTTGTGSSGSDGGNGSNAAVGSRTPAAPVLSVSLNIKQMHFSWNAANDATYYKINQNADGASGFTQLNGNITATSHGSDMAVHRQNWPAARYLLEACNATGCTVSKEITLGNVLQAIGYFKASDTATNDLFARSISLSRDGNTLAVGAMGKDSNSGAVYIFTRQGNSWSQKALVKASDASSSDSFGSSLALSADGNTLAVGAYLEDSLSTGINGSRGSIAENSSNRGAVYVFTRSGDTWAEQAYVKAGSSRDNAYFGGAVALNGDGNTLAVGAIGERTGGMDAGAVYVFTRNASVWSQQAFVKASPALSGAHFGSSITLNGDGNTLAVGAPDEYNGSGSVYVFALSANAWSQHAALKASNTAALDAFGSAVALSANGHSLAVSARNEKSAATGVDGNQGDTSASGAGAVYVFARHSSAWSQQAYVKASNTEANDTFGSSLAFSDDGNTLAVGANGEASAAAGIGGNQADNSSGNAGAAYVFTRNNNAWSQQNYIKASNPGANDLFGFSIALSGDGNTLAVGATGESSAATGVSGNQSDNSAANAGAVYLY